MYLQVLCLELLSIMPNYLGKELELHINSSILPLNLRQNT